MRPEGVATTPPAPGVESAEPNWWLFALSGRVDLDHQSVYSICLDVLAIRRCASRGPCGDPSPWRKSPPVDRAVGNASNEKWDPEHERYVDYPCMPRSGGNGKVRDAISAILCCGLWSPTQPAALCLLASQSRRPSSSPHFARDGHRRPSRPRFPALLRGVPPGSIPT